MSSCLLLIGVMPSLSFFGLTLLLIGQGIQAQNVEPGLPIVDLGYTLQRAASFNVSDSADQSCHFHPLITSYSPLAVITISPTSAMANHPLAIYASLPLSQRKKIVPFRGAATSVSVCKRTLHGPCLQQNGSPRISLATKLPSVTSWKTRRTSMQLN